MWIRILIIGILSIACNRPPVYDIPLMRTQNAVTQIVTLNSIPPFSPADMPESMGRFQLYGTYFIDRGRTPVDIALLYSRHSLAILHDQNRNRSFRDQQMKQLQSVKNEYRLMDSIQIKHTWLGVSFHHPPMETFQSTQPYRISVMMHFEHHGVFQSNVFEYDVRTYDTNFNGRLGDGDDYLLINQPIGEPIRFALDADRQNVLVLFGRQYEIRLENYPNRIQLRQLPEAN